MGEYTIVSTLPYNLNSVANRPEPVRINRQTRRHEKALLRRVEKQRD